MLLGEVRLEFIPPLSMDDVEVVDVLRIVRLDRDPDSINPCQGVSVPPCRPPSTLNPSRKAPKLDSQERGLNRVQASVVPLRRVVVLPRLAVLPQTPNYLHPRGIRPCRGPRFTTRTEILPWIKAEPCQITNRAGTLALVLRTMGLSSVFDEPQMVASGDGHDRIEISRLPIQ